MIAEMNPDWDPFTEHDLLHRSEDTSDSSEMLPSEEYWTTDEHELGFGGQKSLSQPSTESLVFQLV